MAKANGCSPEEVDHVLEIIGPLLTGDYMFLEWVLLVFQLAVQILANEGRRQLGFTHGYGHTEGKDRIDEAMSVSEKDEPFGAKPTHLIRVVGNADMNQANVCRSGLA